MPNSSSVPVLGWGSGGITGVDGQRSGKSDKRGQSDDVNSIHFGANSLCACVCSCVCDYYCI